MTSEPTHTLFSLRTDARPPLPNADSYLALESSASATKDTDAKPDKPKNGRKLCLLAKYSQGHIDRTQVKVCIEGFDEVGGRCGLFCFGESCERPVCDVVRRVEEWIREDATRRFSGDEEMVVVRETAD